MTSPAFVECQLCGEPFPQGFTRRVPKWCRPCYVLVVRKRWDRVGPVLGVAGVSLLPIYGYAPNPYRLIAGWTLGVGIFLAGLGLLLSLFSFPASTVGRWFGKRFGEGDEKATKAVEKAVGALMFVLLCALFLGWCASMF